MAGSSPFARRECLPTGDTAGDGPPGRVMMMMGATGEGQFDGMDHPPASGRPLRRDTRPSATAGPPNPERRNFAALFGASSPFIFTGQVKPLPVDLPFPWTGERPAGTAGSLPGQRDLENPSDRSQRGDGPAAGRGCARRMSGPGGASGRGLVKTGTFTRAKESSGIARRRWAGAGDIQDCRDRSQA